MILCIKDIEEFRSQTVWKSIAVSSNNVQLYYNNIVFELFWEIRYYKITIILGRF